MKITKEDAKERGFTHLAKHLTDGKHHKKGDGVFCKLVGKEYQTGGLTCLFEPEVNYEIKPL